MVARGMERDRFSRGVVVPAFCQDPRPARLDAHASQVLMAADAPWSTSLGRTCLGRILGPLILLKGARSKGGRVQLSSLTLLTRMLQKLN